MNQPPVVAHFSPAPFGPGGVFGGGERYPIELASAMAAHVKTRFVTFGSKAQTVRERGLDIRLLRLTAQPWGSEVNSVAPGLARAFDGVDVVHIHQWNCLSANLVALLTRTLGKKLYVTDHGGYGRNFRLQLRLHRLVHGFLAVSKFSADLFPEMCSKAEVILGGVDSSKFMPPQISKRAGVLFVGRLLPHKGLDILIDALPQGVPLCVIGRAYDPVYLAFVRSRIGGKDVTFQLNASDGELLRAYQSTSVAVLPSVYSPTMGPASKNPELLGLTLLEAMACATPVIASRVGGIPELVNDGTEGVLFEPNDRKALAAAISLLVRDRAVWESYSTSALAKARSLSWNSLALRCLNAYGYYVNEPSPGASSAL